jgi:methionyl-tRNA formyltransferase
VDAIERIVFFGTPAAALPALDALVASGRTPALVVSRPARPAGRERAPRDPPVALRARALGLALEQPERVQAPEFLARLGALAPDLAVVVAFGQIFPRALLELPRIGCVNLHFSLLPRWRGAAPVAAAIAAGDGETGVSLQRMAEGLDSGPLYAARATPIGARETAGELTGRLARLGAELLVETLPRLERGELEPVPQDESRVTWAPKLAGVRELSLAESASDLARAFRAATPEPGAVLAVRGERIKLLELVEAPGAGGAPPGAVVLAAGDALRFACGGGGAIDLLRVQRPGGRPIRGRDLANGLRLAPGERA